MKTVNIKIMPKDLKILGSYGKMYHDSEVYPHTLGKLSKDVKKKDINAITIAAFLLSHIMTPNSVLIPIPQSSGIAEYTLDIANTIKIIRQDCIVIDILSGAPRKKLYDIKKEKSSLEDTDMELKVNADKDCKEILNNNSNIYLLDNVINTGFTFNVARKALKECLGIEPSLMAISATNNWFNDKNV